MTTITIREQQRPKVKTARSNSNRLNHEEKLALAMLEQGFRWVGHMPAEALAQEDPSLDDARRNAIVLKGLYHKGFVTRHREYGDRGRWLYGVPGYEFCGNPNHPGYFRSIEIRANALGLKNNPKIKTERELRLHQFQCAKDMSQQGFTNNQIAKKLGTNNRTISLITNNLWPWKKFRPDDIPQG